MQIKVLFFALYRDLAGGREFEVEVPDGLTVGQLKAYLETRFPGLAGKLPFALAALDKGYAENDELVTGNSEVAFFPPVSGGSSPVLPTVFQITENEIDLNGLLAQITLPSTGAAAIFTGMVRGQTARGSTHETQYLEYEAYIPMAEAKMQQVAAEIRQQWPTVEGVAIVQRVGRLYPGTPTVLIACTAPHRDTGVFDAARYGIDRLKQIVPIWKKEVMPDGENLTEEWVQGDYIPKPGE